MAQIVSEVGDWFYTLSIYTLLLQLTGHAGSVALALVYRFYRRLSSARLQAW